MLHAKPIYRALFLCVARGRWGQASSPCVVTSRSGGSMRTPVALMRQPAWLPPSFWIARNPVLGGASLPHTTARQCMCSGVYLSMRWRPLASSKA